MAGQSWASQIICFFCVISYLLDLLFWLFTKKLLQGYTTTAQLRNEPDYLKDGLQINRIIQ